MHMIKILSEHEENGRQLLTVLLMWEGALNRQEKEIQRR